MKTKIILSLLVLFLLGGCNVLGQKDIAEMDPADLPDVIAFQDDFTREFMSSLEEVEAGYYLFESKTGGYTMMYPKNAKMNEIYYEMPGEAFEAIQFGEAEDTNEFQYFVRSIYESGSRGEDVDSLLGMLSEDANYNGKYQNIELEDKTIHFATSEYVTKSGESISNLFFALIMSNNSDQTVSIRYHAISNDDDKNIDLETIQNEAMKIMESIEFK
ncbi:hypothetical protein [Virgibacillus sp. YIM 98842]|uniref:hypothetical protein n=1 Tax=Virgibacillus sp. YIM 98842 TaxID=2663533 RepID=UPI0013D9C0A5|nr:hypothetical protein [Virgibacillus sp. YIM 98842]